MEVDESLLTGEADRIPKTPATRCCRAASASAAAATYVATRVGADSFANQLTSAARAFREDPTPLQRDVARVMRAMSVLVAIAAMPVPIGDLADVIGGFDPVETARAAAVLVALVPAGPGGHGHGHLRAGHRPAGRRQGAHPALRRGRVDEPRRRAVPRQDGHADDAADRARAHRGRSRRGRVATASWATSWPVGDAATRSADALRAAYQGATPRRSHEEVTFSSELRWSGAALSATGPATCSARQRSLRSRAEGGRDGRQRAEIARLTMPWADEGCASCSSPRVPADAALRDAEATPRCPKALRAAGAVRPARAAPPRRARDARPPHRRRRAPQADLGRQPADGRRPDAPDRPGASRVRRCPAST